MAPRPPTADSIYSEVGSDLREWPVCHLRHLRRRSCRRRHERRLDVSCTIGWQGRRVALSHLDRPPVECACFDPGSISADGQFVAFTTWDIRPMRAATTRRTSGTEDRKDHPGVGI